jgi:lipid II:glycine glycyltransferase (peptidoglycan interpeptide bridge formation enzyme)
MLVKPLPLRLASIAYIPRGPLVNWHDRTTTTLLLDGLHQTARKQGARFLRIEPPVQHSSQAHTMLRDYGFQATRQTNQPRCTLIMSLEADIDTIFADFPRKARRDIRIALERGVKIRQGNEADLTSFYELMRTTAARGEFSSRSREYYELEFESFVRFNHTVLLLAEYETQTIAAQMTFAFGRYGAVFHGASDNAHRNLRANDLLTWESIQWAKGRGCRSFDLWGLPDEIGDLIEQGLPIPTDRRDGLWGVYTFKKGFGGEITYYVGAYDYVYNKTAYSLGVNLLSWLDSISSLARFVDKT